MKKRKWYKIVDHPLRAVTPVIEYTLDNGTRCSTGFTKDMQALVKDLPDSETSPFTLENLRQLKEVA
ncbi:MAG: hypothetical protein GY928_04035 [Colwellia sp.]|nr:hypothetical protein [Colwellia sp.]